MAAKLSTDTANERHAHVRPDGDNIMSRLATISDSGGTLATYTWLGVGTIASQADNQPEIDLDYSADNFAALNRFGNI